MDAHEALLDEWAAQGSHLNRGFVKDGIIDSARWARARRKVLFLLKEAYDDLGVTAGFDLRALIRDEWQGPRGRLWWQAAYWCYAIDDPSGQADFPEGPEACRAASEALLASAVVNIKKSSGRSQSDHDDIATYARRDGSFLKRQIEIVRPDVIVCGNTWWAVKHLWPGAVRVCDGVWKADALLFVDFWHPANQFPNHLNFYALNRA